MPNHDEQEIRVLPNARQAILLIVQVGLCIASISGGVLAGLSLRDRLTPRNWDVVEPGGLYRSGQMHPALVERVLADNQIDVILSLNGRDEDCELQMAQEKAASRLGIAIQLFGLRGNGLPADGKIRIHVAAVTALMRARAEGKRVLVQCSAGANRTGGVIAIYQLLVLRMSGQEVYRQMTDHKWSPSKSPELLAFLNSNMKAIAQALCDHGVLDRAVLAGPIPVIQE